MAFVVFLTFIPFLKNLFLCVFVLLLLLLGIKLGFHPCIASAPPMTFTVSAPPMIFTLGSPFITLTFLK